jgi:DNA helicase II / ATP-dependent DNA helicase PcrA
MLRWEKSSDTLGYRALNIGLSKGRTFARVLVFPTKTMIEYLIENDPSTLKQQTKSKLYVAITRAKHSVAFFIGAEDKRKFSL